MLDERAAIHTTMSFVARLVTVTRFFVVLTVVIVATVRGAPVEPLYAIAKNAAALVALCRSTVTRGI